jgi:hypothetical protein
MISLLRFFGMWRRFLANSSMTRDDFQTTLMAARGAGSDQYERIFQQVREQVRNLGNTQQFDILFPLAVKSQDHAPSCPAAELLWEFSPACPLSCEKAVQALLDEWDVSIEEVPFYLAACYGVPRMKEAVERVGTTLGEGKRDRLETIAYWLNKYEEAYTGRR